MPILSCYTTLPRLSTNLFCEILQGLDENRLKRMLGAQSLWDATMAHSVTKALYRSNLVVHVAGYFHVKQNLGIPEHLAHYCTAIGKSNF